MAHNIKLNFDTDLKFKIVEVTSPEIVTKVAFSVEKGRFINIETTRNKGFVDITNDDPTEWIAEVDGEHGYDNVTFDAVEIEDPTGVRAVLWEVYSFADRDTEREDIEVENIASADIPEAVVDMLF